MAAPINMRLTRTRFIQSLPELPELTVPVLNARIDPRELLADLIYPSPAITSGMFAVSQMGSIVARVVSEPVATPLAFASQALFLYSMLHMSNHAMQQFNVNFQAEAAQLRQERMLQRDHVEIARIPAGQALPSEGNGALKKWMGDSFTQYYAHRDGTTGVQIHSSYDENQVDTRGLEMQSIALPDGRTVKVPKLLLG